MLNQSESSGLIIRNPRVERRLWHDSDQHTFSLGCTKCPDWSMCGGLQLEHGLFDCLDLCCRNPATCDSVCRNKPEEFALRVREVAGFSLDNVPRASVLTASKLPNLVPVLFHGHRRRIAFSSASAVCLPLYTVIQRHDGSIRYRNRRTLAKRYRVASDVPIMLTGTDHDPPLERWWSLGPERREVIRALRRLDIALVTTPNFSLFTDQPRWDDMHSMKRIALVHEEFLSEGLSAALHVNARTDRDWCRWRDYIAARPEVTHIAFEFATGAGWAGRVDWHVKHLIQLAAEVDRPLHLVVRGGGNMFSTLNKAFSGITFLETSAFLKTMKRQGATLTATGTVAWSSCPTELTKPLDRLLTKNWQVVAASYDMLPTGQRLERGSDVYISETADVQCG